MTRPTDSIHASRYVTVPGLAAAIFLLLSVAVANRASAVQPYTFVDLYTLTPPSGFTSASVGPNLVFQGPLGSIANGGQVVGQGTTTSGDSHAVLWTSAGVPIDLHPTQFGAGNSQALSTNGSQQVGYLGNGQSTNDQALLWNGTAASAVNLNPTQLGFTTSYANATDGVHQVGTGTSGSLFHALLWTDTAASAVDLNPAGYNTSLAEGVNGSSQVGGAVPVGLTAHAMLWHGTAASAIDLHPTILDGSGNPVFSTSRALAVSGSQQVGYGYGTISSGTAGISHALLWNGTAASAVDLTPTNLGTNVFSMAFATNGTQQVGWGAGTATGQATHAMVWQGTANSAIDLHQFVPQGLIFSDAYAIDAQGVIYGTAQGLNGRVDSVEWLPVPEPTTISLLLLGGLGILVARRKFP